MRLLLCLAEYLLVLTRLAAPSEGPDATAGDYPAGGYYVDVYDDDVEG